MTMPRVAACVAAGCVAAGCVDVTTLVTVKRNGTGTVLETVYWTGAARIEGTGTAGRAASPAGGSNEGAQGARHVRVVSRGQPVRTGSASIPAEGFTLEDVVEQALAGRMFEAAPADSDAGGDRYRARAAAMGEGVSLIAVDPVTRADGVRGVQVLYGFTDVRKLRLDPDPRATGAPAGGLAAGEDEEDNPRSEPITFDLTAGDPTRLVVKLPLAARPAGGAEADDAAGDAGSEAVSPEEISMVRKMVETLRLRVRLAVDGEIRRTTASRSESGRADGPRDTITLIDADAGALARDEELFRKAVGEGRLEGLWGAAAVARGMPGQTIETGAVEVDF